MMNPRIDDRDLRAFTVYARRELALDKTERRGGWYPPSATELASIAALRALNARRLMEETRQLP